MPNQISLAPFDRKDWIVRKPKYNRYKIFNWKRGERGKGKARRGKTIFAFDLGERMILKVFSYQPEMDGDKVKFKGGDSCNYFLKIKEGRLVIWTVDPHITEQMQVVRRVRNFSNNIDRIEQALFNFGTKHTYSKTPKTENSTLSNEFELFFQAQDERGYITKSEARKFKSVHNRLNNVIKHFLKRNGFKFKFSKNPFQNLRMACYPTTQGFDLKTNSLNSTFSRHSLRGDVKTTIKNCFGHDSAKLVKMVCETIEKEKNFQVMNLGLLLKGLVPLDYMYDAIANVNRKDLNNFGMSAWLKKIADYRRVLKFYNPQRIMKLVKSNHFVEYECSDTVEMFKLLSVETRNAMMPKKPKNWHEIHEALMPHRPVRQNYAIGGYQPDVNKAEHFDLPVRDKFKEIDGAQVEDLKIEVPKNTKDLYSYSSKMSNCIWSYGDRVKQGQCDLLAIYRNEELLYNISIANQEISQFKAKYNAEPNEADKQKVLTLLKEKGIIVEQIKSRISEQFIQLFNEI
jgi:PcfJ-like protein